MNSFTSFSLWIVLASIAPGLVTIASIAVMMYFVDPELFLAYIWLFDGSSEWIMLAVAILIMVMTQSIGILQQKIFRNAGIYKEKTDEISMESFRNKIYYTSLMMDKEYKTDKTIERIAAQFYLSNNILVSFDIALMTGIFLILYQPFSSLIKYSVERFIYGMIFFLVLYIIGLIVASSRYQLMMLAKKTMNQIYEINK